ncbi:calcium:proton antiporter [Roseococcus thiosulfatophilus]|uniref:calcium:proton antiporter n=1 Tax=Roseococcus thiosulfatophilus TaxID=35813 RepID=UPI001A8DA80A|nr:ionic transporter y4hA [Roseococcus thiosulfatophilus]
MRRFPWWSLAFPAIGLAELLVTGLVPMPLVAVTLIGVIFAAVRHAETVAQRLGNLLGALVLAVSITVIEAGLIVSMMLGGAEPTVARDSIFAALMIALNGVLGLSLLLGGRRWFEQSFRTSACNAFLAVLIPLAVLTLVLPSHTISAAGPVYSPPQLLFVAVVSLSLYVAFLYVQLVRHRAEFVADHDIAAGANGPGAMAALVAGGLLLLSLVCVVLLAKALAPVLEAGVRAADLPLSLVGVAIALLVLMPEGLTALRAAARNNLQAALNLTLGSVLACVGLTIPAVAVVALATGQPLHLGLDAAMTVLLATTFLMLAITLNTGRTTVLEGMVHLSIFAAFVMFSFLP